MNKKCEVIKENEECGNEAKFIVRHKDHAIEKAFSVCIDCIPAYRHIQFKEYGNTHGNFIVEEINHDANQDLDAGDGKC